MEIPDSLDLGNKQESSCIPMAQLGGIGLCDIIYTLLLPPAPALPQNEVVFNVPEHRARESLLSLSLSLSLSRAHSLSHSLFSLTLSLLLSLFLSLSLFLL